MSSEQDTPQDPNSADPSTDNEEIEQQLLGIRREFALPFKIVTYGILGLILVTVLAMLVPLARGKDIITSGATAMLIQVGLVMVLGFGCVFFGVILSWLGVSAAFSARYRDPSGTAARLQSSGPGIVLLLGGMILIGSALYRDVTIRSPSPNGGPDVQGGSGGAGTVGADGESEAGKSALGG